MRSLCLWQRNEALEILTEGVDHSRYLSKTRQLSICYLNTCHCLVNIQKFNYIPPPKGAFFPLFRQEIIIVVGVPNQIDPGYVSLGEEFIQKFQQKSSIVGCRSVTPIPPSFFSRQTILHAALGVFFLNLSLHLSRDNAFYICLVSL